jgi:uncharacterized damage-inducible protein DinB
MSLSKLISNYADYNLWANERAVEFLRTQDEDVFYAETPSSFNTLDGTLQHMLRTQKFWLAFVSEQDLTGFSWAIRKGEASKILSELVANSINMRDVFTQFSEDQLNEILHLRMPWASNDCSRYEYCTHVINHSTFHRGQIVTMARCLGINEGIPATDYNIYNTIK